MYVMEIYDAVPVWRHFELRKAVKRIRLAPNLEYDFQAIDEYVLGVNQLQLSERRRPKTVENLQSSNGGKILTVVHDGFLL